MGLAFWPKRSVSQRKTRRATRSISHFEQHHRVPHLLQRDSTLTVANGKCCHLALNHGATQELGCSKGSSMSVEELVSVLKCCDVWSVLIPSQKPGSRCRPC